MRYATALLALILAAGCSAPLPPGEVAASGSAAADSGATAGAGADGPVAEETLPVTTGFAENGGTRLYYEEAGQGLPLILVHGGMLDRRMWDDQFQALAQRFRVVRFDARGHGESTVHAGENLPHEDLANLLDQLKIDKAILVGHSMGARVAIDFAIAHPDRLLALVAVAPGLSGYTRSGPETNDNYRLFAKAMLDKRYDLAVEHFQKIYTDGPLRSPFEVDPETRVKVGEMALGTLRSERIPGRTRSVEPPAFGRLSEIGVPTLVIHGDLDTPDTLEISGLLEQQIPGAKRVVIPGTAHMVNMEQPEEFNAELVQFLGQTFP